MKIVHCGDSYTVGVGCIEPRNSTYARLVSDHFGSEYLTLARPGASIYVTYLQAMYAAKLSPDIVVINTTSLDRTEWIMEGSTYSGPLDGTNIMAWAPGFKENFDFYFEDQPDHNPIIFSETIGFLDYIAKIDHHKIRNEPKKKLSTILEYTALYRDERIHNDYCDGLLIKAHAYLTKRGITPVYILNKHFTHLSEYFQHYIELDFFDLSEIMPGKLPDKMHCSEEAHEMVAKDLINTINAIQR